MLQVTAVSLILDPHTGLGGRTSIPRQAAEKTLRGLPDYVRHHGLPFSAATTVDERQIEIALRSLW